MTLKVHEYLKPASRLASVLLIGAAFLVLPSSNQFVAASDDDDEDEIAEFVEDLEIEDIREHQERWQKIANRNDGTRLAGTAGYDESADYVVRELQDEGYDVTVQPFEFQSFRQTGPSTLEQTAPVATTYVEDTDYNLMSQSDGSPGVTGAVTGVDLALADPSTSTSGCEAADFTGFPAGNIALVQRGACTFQLKAENAANAGAVGAIIFNQGNDPGRMGLINGTLSSDYSGGIPVFFATFPLGQEWANTAGLTMTMAASVFRGIVTTHNVIAEYSTPANATAPVIVVGAHLDSVPDGPGIQDNGSGSAAILEIARELKDEELALKNRVRFAWWSAEESGLVGSQFYVDNLTQAEQDEIALNLNFDMIGSPNGVRFIYDGDGSDTPVAGPPGSDIIEQVFIDHFAARGLANEPSEFSGRSDYGPFIAVGIPAGGLFTGAEVLKTADQAAIYGGTAGVAYDPCYHLACDDFDNINLQMFEEMSKAAADVMLTLANMDLPLVTAAPATLSALSVTTTTTSNNLSLDSFDRLGSHFQK